MKANKYLVPALVIGLLLATVGVAQATGYWIVSGKQMIDIGSMATSDDIRGWMSIEEIAQGFDLDLATVYSLTGIPTDTPPDTALKDLETVLTDFEVTTVREAIAAHLGEEAATDDEPVESNSEPAADSSPDPTAIPTTAPDVAPTATPDHEPIGDGIGVGIGDGSGDGSGATVEGYLAGADIKGANTLQTIAQQGQIDLDELIAALGLPPDTDPSTMLRSLVASGDIDEVTTVRDIVTALQQK